MHLHVTDVFFIDGRYILDDDHNIVGVAFDPVAANNVVLQQLADGSWIRSKKEAMMPLTSKGEEIMGNMEKEYKSPEKAKEVFYASANKGTIKGVHNDRSTKMANDVEKPEPASGPMSTKGPVGTSEGLPKTTEPFNKVTDASEESGKAMSLDSIKEMGKRIGRY